MINTIQNEKIIRLWHETFGDKEDFILEMMHFFKEKGGFFGFVDENDTLLCMMFYLDLPLFDGEESRKSAYIYACATKEECRGKGIFSKLFESAKNQLSNDGYEYIFCVPQDLSLFEFYKKLGFDIVFSKGVYYSKNDGKRAEFEIKKLENTKEIYKLYKENFGFSGMFPNKDFDTFEKALLVSQYKCFSFKDGLCFYDGGDTLEFICKENADKQDISNNLARYFEKQLTCLTFPKGEGNLPFAAATKIGKCESNTNVSAYASMLFE